MKINSFEEIVAWQKARELTLLIYKNFRFCKDFSFKDQIQRASVSIMNNIAEGFERGGNKELRHFFYMAKGSCAEVRSMLDIALSLKYTEMKSFTEMNNLSIETSKILSGFIKTL